MGERERSPKLPITCDLLTRILASASHLNLSSRLNFEAATTTAFSGFLRCGEFTTHSSRNFDPSTHLTRSSVQFVPSIIVPSHMVLTVLASKTDPFRKGIAITIASAPGARTCAVTALKSLFKYIERPPELPLFTQDDGTPLSRNSFIGLLKSSLTRAGFDVSKFSGHSFCHGAASSAAAVGFNNYEIQLLGRWCSNSYKLYIDNSQARLLSLSSHLHWAITHGQPFEPPSLLLPSYLA